MAINAFACKTADKYRVCRTQLPRVSLHLRIVEAIKSLLFFPKQLHKQKEVLSELAWETRFFFPRFFLLADRDVTPK